MKYLCCSQERPWCRPPLNRPVLPTLKDQSIHSMQRKAGKCSSLGQADFFERLKPLPEIINSVVGAPDAKVVATRAVRRSVH